jgi:hypothetical protein
MLQEQHEENTNEPVLLFQKNELTTFKLSKNEYSLTFPLRNSNIYLDKLINMRFLEIIYALNKDDIIQDFNLSIEDTNEDKATLYVLFKHFFADFGFQQKYVFLHMNIEKCETHITYKGKTITNYEKNNIPQNAELLHLNDICVECNIEDPHNVIIHSKIKIKTKFEMEIPSMIEKMASIILDKIFMKLKQLIENY